MVFSTGRDAWKIIVSISATSSHRDFNSVSGIASVPVALYGFMSFNSFRTPFLLTMMVVVSSTMKTDVNRSLSILDFLMLSLWLIPSESTRATCFTFDETVQFLGVWT